jgi:3-phosphoshikimate 1-carboxyvinyltransferase
MAIASVQPHGQSAAAGGDITVDASASSQFLSGLLLAGARYANGIDIQHVGGEIPSRPHIQMTLAMLRARGVEINDTVPDRWVVTPGAIQPLDVTIEPDLSNAAPFLAAAAITGGTVRSPIGPPGLCNPAMRSGRSCRTLAPGSISTAATLKFKAPISYTQLILI